MTVAKSNGSLHTHGFPRPIRIGFVLGSFTYGGAEHDVIQLITQSDPQQLHVVGMAVQTCYPICPDLPLDHPRVPPIYQPEAVTKHHKVINSASFGAAVRKVAARADILVAWGVRNLADFIPRDFQGRIVVTSKASGEYQESFIHDNALLTSDYVANSIKSTEAFPAPVRQRAHVIYPGIDQRRIARNRDRDKQRAAWGFRPNDRVVGYLGRIAPDKGVEKLVASVAKMPRNWKVAIVGRNGNDSQYERRFARICRRVLPNRHRIVDWTTEIGDALSAFDVLAYVTEDEGFSNTLAEAWLLGVPTVTTAGVGALAEPRWARCSVTVPRDFKSRDLSRALTTAFGNDRLIARSKRRARALTVQNTLAEWQQYFRHLMDHPRRTRVMVILSNLIVGGIPSWLFTLMRQTPKIDWCCVCVLSEYANHAADPEMVSDILQQGCPIVAVPPSTTAVTRRRLEETMRQTRPDVVLQSGVKRLDACFPQTDIPLIAISHGPANCEWAREVLAKSSDRATHRVAISRTSRRAYPRAHRASVSIIANGVSIPQGKELTAAARQRARSRLGLGRREIAVGFVGRLSPEKNPLCVAAAIEHLPSSYRGVFLGPDCAKLWESIREISPRSRKIGPVPPSEIASYMPGFDILVCPSAFESFGLVIVEAWAALVPVVTTRVGIVDELVDDFDVAVVVPFSPSPAKLADAIRQAHDEREKRIYVCRALACERFDARQMAEQWQDYLLGAAGHAQCNGHADNGRRVLGQAGLEMRGGRIRHAAMAIRP